MPQQLMSLQHSNPVQCMQVVRAAVENGTLHQFIGPSKSRTTFPPSEVKIPARQGSQAPSGATNTMPPLGNAPPPTSAATAACSQPNSGASGGADVKSAPCVLCAVVKPKEEIAMFVAGDAFCVPCDRIRRRANNLGLGYAFVSNR